MTAPAADVDARFLEVVGDLAPATAPSRSELDVAYLLSIRDMTLAQVASARGVSSSTARTHWRRFADKVGLDAFTCRRELQRRYWRREGAELVAAPDDVRPAGTWSTRRYEGDS